MKFMKPTMIAFAAVTAVIMVLASMQVFFKWEFNDAATVVAVVILSIFAIATIVGMFGQKFSLRRLGMYALHVGLLFFLLGSLIYYCIGISVPVAVPINGNVSYDTIEAADGTKHKLGFEFSMNNFKIERYDPVYDVVETKGGKEYVVMKDVSIDNNGYFDFGKYGKLHYNQLVSGGDLVSHYDFSSTICARKKMPVKEYTGTVRITDLDLGQTFTEKILVNSPIRYKGYKIYLLGCDEASATISLLFKKDPTEFLTTAGIIITMLGCFYTCIASAFVDKAIVNYKVKKVKELKAREKKQARENKQSGEKKNGSN